MPSDDPAPTPDRPAEGEGEGVAGEDPTRFDREGTGPLDESPDGRTPSDVTDGGDEDSLPPKLL
jgi:hypothetical protein